MKNESASLKHHFFTLKLSKWRVSLLLLLLAVVVAVIFLLARPSEDNSGFIGSWYCPEQTLELKIDESQITINDFCFPYELCSPIQTSPDRQHPQGFVIAAGSMGTLAGKLFLEDGQLYVEIDGNTKVFMRSES